MVKTRGWLLGKVTLMVWRRNNVRYRMNYSKKEVQDARARSWKNLADTFRCGLLQTGVWENSQRSLRFSVATLAQRKALSPLGGEPGIGEVVPGLLSGDRGWRNSTAKHGFRLISSTEWRFWARAYQRTECKEKQSFQSKHCRPLSVSTV